MTRHPVALLAAGLLLAGCGGGGDEPASPPASQKTPAGGEAAARVQIKTFIFNPDPIEVKPGTEVTFVNLDATTHTVTAGTRKKPRKSDFDASLDQNGEFKHTFAEAGTYDYFCDLHSGDGMVGRVVVKG